MKCILVSGHGDDIDSLLSLSTDYAKPTRKLGEVLIKIRACVLAPGDVRVMKGDCDYFQSPRSFPYIPGGDVSGIVEEADKYSRFKPGDAVMAMFEVPRPLDGLAEYASVDERRVEFAPKQASFAEAACLTSSALAALFAARLYIKENSRIMILGGSGGVGTFMVQLAANAGASFICATSTTDESLLKSLGAHRVIDYTKENWWTFPEFQAVPFDCIFDLGVAKQEGWNAAKNAIVLKSGWKDGKYVTFSGDEPDMKIHSLWQTLTFVYLDFHLQVSSEVYLSQLP
jgi:NADPH:quinone reductase-like Zn-dependent oxidoreductase